MPVVFFFETATVAPCAIFPVQLYAALATGAVGGKTGLAAQAGIILATPWAVLHGLGNRCTAVAAFMSAIQRLAKFFYELFG